MVQKRIKLAQLDQAVQDAIANGGSADNSAALNGQPGSYYLNRTNHSGTQSADTITDGTTNKAYTATEKTKLAGIATGATANDTDANLKNRANHTGTQAISTVTGLQTALDGKTDTNYVDTKVAALVSGSPTTLDTLDELANALGDDPNFATTVATNIGTKASKAANLADLTSASAARNNLGLAAVAASGAYSDLSGKPSFATVATSGDYNDLANKPVAASPIPLIIALS